MSQSKRKKAVALQYDPTATDAPVIIASGYGETAGRIIEIAEKQGIPVYRDDSAASLLCMLEVGSPIPTQLYEVVATVYAQFVKLAAERGGGVQEPPP